MPRATTTLVVFFLGMNLFAGMLVTTGVDRAIGLNANVGGDEIQDGLPEEGVKTGSATGQTLFGMYNVATEQVKNIFATVMPALDMMQRAGVPSYLTNLLGTLFLFILTIDLISFLRGYDL